MKIKQSDSHNYNTLVTEHGKDRTDPVTNEFVGGGGD